MADEQHVHAADTHDSDPDHCILCCEDTKRELRDERDAGWRPINTAPRDGGHILIYIPKEDPTIQRVKEAWWSIPHEDALLEQGGWQTMGGVCLSADIHKGLGASHWMPLPRPPIGG